MNDPYAAAGNHPTESTLADLVLGDLDEAAADAVTVHVRNCGSCRVLAEHLTNGLREHHDLPEGDGVDGGSTAAVPAPALAAIAGADPPEAGPSAGELWRVTGPGGRGDGSVSLVWVRAVTSTTATMVPVSMDPEFADEHTLVIPAESSPLGVPLAVHTGIEATFDHQMLHEMLLDRVGSIDGGALAGMPSGPPVFSALDQRAQYRGTLADDVGVGAIEPGPDDARLWWPSIVGSDLASDRAKLLTTIHEVLGAVHPGARIVPAPPSTAWADDIQPVAQVAELDAFVLVAFFDQPLDGQPVLAAARQILEADQLLNAACLVQPAGPFASVIVDRRDVVDAIETPSGELRPPRQSRPPAPIGEALTKFLDNAITPFGRLASTVVDAQAIDPRGLAVDVSGDAVRSVEVSARGFKVEGKRPGYERVSKHRAAISRLVEEALTGDDVDVATILDDDE